MSGGPPIAPLATKGQRRFAARSRSIHAPITRPGEHARVSPDPARADLTFIVRVSRDRAGRLRASSSGPGPVRSGSSRTRRPSADWSSAWWRDGRRLAEAGGGSVRCLIDMCVSNRHSGHRNAGSSDAVIKDRRSAGRFRAFLVIRHSAAMSSSRLSGRPLASVALKWVQTNSSGFRSGA